MYPVKVYDKHGNLIREYTQEEMNKHSDETLKGNTHRKKQMHWKTRKVQEKHASETNNALFTKEHNIEAEDKTTMDTTGTGS